MLGEDFLAVFRSLLGLLNVLFSYRYRRNMFMKIHELVKELLFVVGVGQVARGKIVICLGCFQDLVLCFFSYLLAFFVGIHSEKEIVMMINCQNFEFEMDFVNYYVLG